MTLLKEIVTELFGMFVADARLTIGVLALIAAAAVAIDAIGLDPLLGGTVLVIGCPLLLIGNVRRHRRITGAG
jgi:hypothetical protein